MQAGNVVSLVKRTLFEANSKACRLGRASLTSVLTGGLLLATPPTVKPDALNIAPGRKPNAAARPRDNFLSQRNKRGKEYDRFLSVSRLRFVRKDQNRQAGQANLLNGPLNDNEQAPSVTLITGRVRRRKGDQAKGVHVLLVAPDDDSAVRRALEALASEGYAEAELDQIGDMQGEPDEEPHLSAWQGALEGEVSIVFFDEPF